MYARSENVCLCLSLSLSFSRDLSLYLSLSLSISIYLFLSLSSRHFSHFSCSLLLFCDSLSFASLLLMPPEFLLKHHSSFIILHLPQFPLPTPHSSLPTPHSPFPTPHSPLPTPHTQFPISWVVGRYGHRMIYDACMSIFDDLLKGNPSTLLDEPDPALPTTGPFKKTSHKVGKTCVRQHPYHYSCTWVGLLHRILRLTYIYFIFLILQRTL